jgi:hypothetical protein
MEAGSQTVSHIQTKPQEEKPNKVKKRPKIKIEKFTTSDGETLSIYMIPPKSGNYYALLFVPILIGGSYLQQYNYYEKVVDDGEMMFVSFSYRGHRSSTGKFDIASTLTDSLDIANHIRDKFGLPIYAVGACGGSVPLAYCLDKDPSIFQKIALVNSINTLQHAMGNPFEILWKYRRVFPRYLFNLSILINEITSTVFPHIDQSQNHFGHLDYGNANTNKLLWEYFFFDALKVQKPVECPTLCCMATRDYVLDIETPEKKAAYMEQINATYKNTKYVEVECDHYLTGAEEKVSQIALDFFEE